MVKETSHILHTVCIDSPTTVVRNYIKRYKKNNLFVVVILHM